jgi:hypothetical protein
MFNRSRVQVTLPLLSPVQARKCVREGAQAYLAYVSAKPKVESNLESISVVRPYPDVFAEVTGLPLDREIEFTINLVLGTQPIHKASYCMALGVERVEFSLFRGFICPSVSPCWALVLFMKKDKSMKLCINYCELNRVEKWNWLLK